MSPKIWDRRTLKNLLGFITIISFGFPLYYLINWIELFSFSDKLVPQEKINQMMQRFFNAFADIKSIAKWALISLVITVNLSILWLNTFARRGPKPPYISIGMAIVLLVIIFITMVYKIEV